MHWPVLITGRRSGYDRGKRFSALTARATLPSRCYFRRKMLVALIEGSRRRAERDRHYCHYLLRRDYES